MTRFEFKRVVRALGLIAFVFGFSVAAGAACSSPTGTAGEVEWNSSASENQYCDGTSWNSLSVQTTSSTCSTAGQIQYNSPDLQTCDGSHWISHYGGSLGTTCTATGTWTYDSTNLWMKWCDGSNWRMMGAGSSNSSAASISYLGSSGDPSDLSTYTLSSQPLGTPASDRYIIVGIAARSGTATSISSVTVAGVTATALYQAQVSSTVAGLYIVALPTGTTGNVVVTFGATMVRMGISLWSVRRLQSTTPTATYTLSGTPSASINVSAGGLAVGMIYNSNSTAISWTGLNTDNSTIITDTLNLNFSGASYSTTTAVTSRAVSLAVTSAWSFDTGVIAALR